MTAGFVLDRAQWLDRFGDDRLRVESIDWTTDSVRPGEGWATLVGVQDQTATYAGRPANGRFRACVTANLNDGQWRLTTIQFSPLGGPPPFAPPTPPQQAAPEPPTSAEAAP